MSTRKVKERRPKQKPAAQLEAGRAAFMAGKFDTAREIWMPLAESGDAHGDVPVQWDGIPVCGLSPGPQESPWGTPGARSAALRTFG